MATMTKEAREAFLAEPHVGVLSVAGTPGRPPLSVPTFYAYEPGGELTMFTGTQRRTPRRIDQVRATGQATLVVQREEHPPAYVTVEAELVSIDQPPAEEGLLRIARRYMPAEYATGFVSGELGDPGSTIMLLTFRPVRWFSSDMSQG